MDKNRTFGDRTPKVVKSTPSVSDTVKKAIADANANGTLNSSQTKMGITGVPLGSPVRTGVQITPGPWSTGLDQQPTFSKTSYSLNSPYLIPNTLSNSDKANLLYKMSLVPNLYKKGTAPTRASISAMGTSIVFRDQDYTAFSKVLKNSDNTGAGDYNTSLNNWLTNPASAAAVLSGTNTKKARVIPFTPPGDASAYITSKYLDLFNKAPDSSVINNYTKDLHTAEVARGGQISQQEQENIFLKYAQSTATGTAHKAVTSKNASAMSSGQLGDIVKQVRGAYNDNGIPLSDSQIYIKAIAAIRSPQALQNELQLATDQAGLHWAAFKPLIDKGQTVLNLLAPYMAVRSQITGKPLSQMQPSDFYSVASDSKGPISPTDYGKTLYNTPEYKSSDNYMNQTMSDLQYTMKAFGIG